MNSKPSADLLNLDFFGSTASTPTGGGYMLPSPMSPMSDGAINSDTSTTYNTTQSSSSKYSKICLMRPLKNRQNKGLNGKL